MRLADHVVQLELDRARLDEVDVISFVADVIDDFTWFEGLLLEELAHLDHFLDGPVAQDGHLLKQLLANALSVHPVDAHYHVEGCACAQKHPGVVEIAHNCEVSPMAPLVECLENDVVADDLVLFEALDNFAFKWLSAVGVLLLPDFADGALEHDHLHVVFLHLGCLVLPQDHFAGLELQRLELLNQVLEQAQVQPAVLRRDFLEVIDNRVNVLRCSLLGIELHQVVDRRALDVAQPADFKVLLHQVVDLFVEKLRDLRRRDLVLDAIAQ